MSPGAPRTLSRGQSAKLKFQGSNFGLGGHKPLSGPFLSLRSGTPTLPRPLSAPSDSGSGSPHRVHLSSGGQIATDSCDFWAAAPTPSHANDPRVDVPWESVHCVFFCAF